MPKKDCSVIEEQIRAGALRCQGQLPILYQRAAVLPNLAVLSHDALLRRIEPPIDELRINLH
eukprot:11422312-Prorocentrum_lima.AAC.1